MASEHLNKLLKEIEYEETNFGNTSLLQADTHKSLLLPNHPLHGDNWHLLLCMQPTGAQPQEQAVPSEVATRRDRKL